MQYSFLLAMLPLADRYTRPRETIRGDWMAEDSRPIGPPLSHILETEVRGDISLYDARREKVLVLNSTASDVWRLCDGEQTLGEVVALLATAYRADPAAIRPDVERTVRQLIDEGFLPAS